MYMHVKKFLFLFLITLTCAPAQLFSAANDHEDYDDFASFFEDLLSGEGDNSFMDMFRGEEKQSSNRTSNPSAQSIQPTTEMPNPERVTLLIKISNSLLRALDELIKTTHPHHPLWGGAVYEKIKQHRHSFTTLESTLLHLKAIQKKLPKKEIEPFIKVLEKHGKIIIDQISGLKKTTPLPKFSTIEEENAFLLGESDSLRSLISASDQKKLVAGMTGLEKKLTPLITELSKLLESPEIKKLFPATSPSKYQPKSSSSSYRSSPSSSRSNTSRNKSSKDWDGADYDARSNYASDYGYDDYDGYGGQGGLGYDNQNKSGPDTKEDTKDKAPVGQMAPPATQKETKDIAKDFVERVKDLQENELVTLLQKTLEGGSLLTNTSYFPQNARIFEQLFSSHKDGGLSSLASRLKMIDREFIEAEKKHAEQTNPKTQEAKLHIPDNGGLEKNKEKEKAEKALAEALEDYAQTKQGIASAIMRLLYTPTEHRVNEGGSSTRTIWMLPEHSMDEENPEAEKHLGTTISRNVLDREDHLCRQGRQHLKNFLDLLSKKFDLKTYLATQEQRIKQEINQFESTRNQNITTLAGGLVTAHATSEHLQTLQRNVERLAKYAHELHHEAPTVKTCDLHFYKLTEERTNKKNKKILTEKETQALKDGHGTTRFIVMQALNGLEEKLNMHAAAESGAQNTLETKMLKLAIHNARASWSPTLSITTDQPRGRPAHDSMNTLESSDHNQQTSPTPTASPDLFQGVSQGKLQDLLGSISHQPKNLNAE